MNHKMVQLTKIVLFLLSSFLFCCVMIVFVYGKIVIMGKGAWTESLSMALWHSIFLAGMFLIVFAFIRIIDKRNLSDIGIGFNRVHLISFLKGSVIGAGAGFMTWLIILFIYKPHYASTGKGFIEVISYVIFWCIFSIIQASYEELMFRSYAAEKMENIIGRTYSILIISILFAAMHLLNPNYRILAIFSTLISSLLYTVGFYRSRSTLMAIGLHSGWNFILGTVLFNKFVFHITGGTISCFGVFMAENSIGGCVFPALGCLAVYYCTASKQQCR